MIARTGSPSRSAAIGVDTGSPAGLLAGMFQRNPTDKLGTVSSKASGGIQTPMPSRERHSLYPPIEPYRTGRLAVSGGHEIYFEECGNRAGKPVLIVHGGPGGGSNPTMRRYHDPSRYRIILFDQRGCGRSTPHASLHDNTTWDLIADMEQLRRHIGITRWQLLGGSWGSTLSIAYAETYPEYVSELICAAFFWYGARNSNGSTSKAQVGCSRRPTTPSPASSRRVNAAT